MDTTIGNRTYTVKDTPVGSVHITTPILVVWGPNVLQLDYTWSGGYIGSSENWTYSYAKLSELNGSRAYITSTNEIYEVVKTDSKKLNERFKLEYL